MNITFECRYLYLVPKGNKYYPGGHYGSLMAVDMRDARQHLNRWCRGAEIVCARLGWEGCELADSGGQEYRKAIFDKAINDRSTK